MVSNILGFNGMRSDPVSGVRHLGNGYRVYHPVLSRFSAPDSWSPFGAGGINPYAYCAGDPVNRADPSGHFSLGQGLGMVLGLVGGFVLGVLTEGMALPVVASLLANMAGDAAIGALSELTTEAVDGQQINGGKVGRAALVNAGFSLAGFGLGRLSKLKGTRNRPFGGLMMEGEGAAVAGNVDHPAPSLENIPPEMFHKIAANLDMADLQYLSQTSKTLRSQVNAFKSPGRIVEQDIVVGHTSDGEPINLALDDLLNFSTLEDPSDEVILPQVQWVQDLVMGKTQYYPREIYSRRRGITSIPDDGMNTVTAYNPRRFILGNYVLGEYTEEMFARDNLYRDYLKRHLPSALEGELTFFRWG
jgi:RHS repeat-associated protein